MASPRSKSGNQHKTSSWRAVRMPRHSTVARSLQQRYRLRWHGLKVFKRFHGTIILKLE